MAATWIPRPPTDTFAGRLRVLRLALGDISVEEASDRCGLPTATWRTWEKGAHPRRMADVVARIEDSTGVDRDWLMWGGDTGHPQPTGPAPETGSDHPRPTAPGRGADLLKQKMACSRTEIPAEAA